MRCRQMKKGDEKETENINWQKRKEKENNTERRNGKEERERERERSPPAHTQCCYTFNQLSLHFLWWIFCDWAHDLTWLPLSILRHAQHSLCKKDIEKTFASSKTILTKMKD